MKESRGTSAGLLLHACVLLVCSSAVSAQTLHRAQAVGGTGEDIGRAVAVDDARNSYVTGQFSGTVVFGPRAEDTLTSYPGTADMFVAKYKPDGELDWVKQAGGTVLAAGDPPFATGQGIAVAGDDIYVTGTFTGSEVFGSLTSLGKDRDLFIVHYDSAGTLKGQIRAGGTSALLGAAPNSVIGLGIVAVDFGQSDEVYVTGVFSGTVSFGTLTKSETFPCAIAAGSCLHGDLFVAKYSLSSATPVWFNQAGGGLATDRASGHGIAVNNFGVYVVGTFRGTAAFPGGPAAPAFGAQDVLVAKLDAGNGSVASGWPKVYGSASDDAGYGIAVSLDGTGILIAGSFGVGSFPTHGVVPHFLVKLDGSGDLRWARGAGSQTATGVVVDADGNSYVTGLFNTPGVTTPAHALTLDSTTGTGVRVDAGANIFTIGDVGKQIHYNNSDGIARIIGLMSESAAVVDILEGFASTAIPAYDWSFVPGVNFGAPGDPLAFLSALGFADMFTAMYDKDGHLRWIGQAHSETPSGAAAGSGITIDVDGSVHVVGLYTGEVTFGRGYTDGVPVFGPLTPLPAAAAEEDIFVAKYGGNTPIGNNQTVTLPGGEGINRIVLTFDTVTSAGDTTVSYTSNSPDCPAPTDFQLISACLLIETTAGFSGSVRIEVHYDQSALGLSDADEPQLTLRHWDSQQLMWEVINDVTVSPNPNTTQDVIYGVTASFSPFALTLPMTPELDHINLDPGSATIAAGASQAYTVEAIDQFGNSLGDVTADTVFSISPDGSCTGASCTASVPGTHSVTASYNGKSATANLTVTATSSTFTFEGFFAPVDMSTTTDVVWNSVKAGQGIPLKWLLTQNGTPVSDTASFLGVSSYAIPCPGAGALEDAIEQTASVGSGLQYNADGNWQYNWKTPPSYKNSCRAVVVRLSDGQTSPPAMFSFK